MNIFRQCGEAQQPKYDKRWPRTACMMYSLVKVVDYFVVFHSMKFHLLKVEWFVGVCLFQWFHLLDDFL